MGWLWGRGAARDRRLDPPAACPRVAEHERLTLHYPARWPVRQSPGEFLVRCSLEVIDLAELFGFAFPRPVQVFAFPTCEKLNEHLGLEVQYSGYALFDHTAVAVALDAGDILRILRHELAHLYSHAWGPYPPAFKGEGLAVWCEFKRDRELIDREVRYGLFDLGLDSGVSLPPLESLLDDKVFLHPRNAGWNYALAGSFTRWVVRQRGWPVYRDFYRTATAGNYPAEFTAHFGMTLSAAENGWHRHLHALSRGGAKLATRPPRWGAAE
jgi:hypothetical protein